MVSFLHLFFLSMLDFMVAVIPSWLHSPKKKRRGTDENHGCHCYHLSSKRRVEEEGYDSMMHLSIQPSVQKWQILTA